MPTRPPIAARAVAPSLGGRCVRISPSPSPSTHQPRRRCGAPGWLGGCQPSGAGSRRCSRGGRGGTIWLRRCVRREAAQPERRFLEMSGVGRLRGLKVSGWQGAPGPPSFSPRGAGRGWRGCLRWLRRARPWAWTEPAWRAVPAASLPGVGTEPSAGGPRPGGRAERGAPGGTTAEPLSWGK